MDLSTIEGLSEAQIAGIQAAHDTDVTGLKNSNTKLMDEAKNAKTASAEKDSTVEEARKALVAAEEKRLVDAGEWEAARKIGEDERAKLVAEANNERDLHKSALDKYHLSTAKSGVLSKVVEGMEDFASAMLDKSVSVSYDDSGNAVTVFKHGDKEFATATDFINGVGEDAGWSRILRGADSSGAGAKQSNNAGGASSGKPFNEMTMKEKVAYMDNKAS